MPNPETIKKLFWIETDLPNNALDDLNTAISFKQKDPDFYRLRADIKKALEKYDDALMDIEIAINKNPNEIEFKELKKVISFLEALSNVLISNIFIFFPLWWILFTNSFKRNGPLGRKKFISDIKFILN